MPRVSVIVAAHDAAATLPDTLASIAAQTFADWEVVVCDDGSADGTGDIARAFAAGPIRVVRNETAGGPAAARNRAVREARGELLALLDSDDQWLPDYLERQVAACDGGQRVGVVTCDARLLLPDGSIAAETWADRVGPVEPPSLERMLLVNRICSVSLVPRVAYEQVGGQDEDIFGAEDHDLWLRLIEAGYEVVSTPEPLAVYRINPGGITASSARIARVASSVYEKALERGRLGTKERRIARRQIRLFRALELRARLAEQGGNRRARLRALALNARVVAEHPERWGHWLRRGARSAGPSRHS